MKDYIYIKIGDEYLDLEDNVSISIINNSPLFDDEVLKGDYTLPFNIPLTEKNRRLLKRPDDVKNSESLVLRLDCIFGSLGKEYDAYIKTLFAERFTKTSASIFIKDSRLVQSKETSIRSFDYGTVTIPEELDYKEMHFSWNRDGFLPVYAPFNVLYMHINGFFYNATYITGHEPGTTMSLIDYNNSLDEIISKINADTTRNKVTASRSRFYSNAYWYSFGIKIVATIPGKYAPLYLSDNWSTYNPHWLEMRFKKDLDTGEELINYMNNVVNGVNGEQRFIFAPMYFEKIYANIDFELRDELISHFSSIANYDFNHFVNNWDTDTNSFTKNDIKNPNTTSVIPLPFLKHIVTTLFKNLGYNVQGSFFKDEELSRLVFFNTATLDRIQNLTWLAPLYYPPYHYYRIPTNVFDDTIKISNHVPDITVSKMISLIRKTFGCYVILDSESKDVFVGLLKNVINDPETIDWENKSLEYQKRLTKEETGVTLKYSNDPADEALKDIVPSIDGYTIKPSVATVVDLPLLENQENDLRLVLDENAYYIATFENILGDIIWNWQFYSLNEYDFVYAGGSLKIETGNSLTLMVEKDSKLLPYFSQLAKTTAYNQATAEFSPRLMIYRGFKDFVVDGDTVSVPTINRIADDDDKYSIEFDGEKGIFNQFYKPWLEFITNAEPVEKQLDLNQSEIANTKWDKFYRIEGVNYLISQMKYTVSKNNVSIVNVKLYGKK